jgi:hypothetical protein
MDLCSTVVVVAETTIRRSIRHRNHVVASPELFAERKMPLIIRTAIGDPDATYESR